MRLHSLVRLAIVSINITVRDSYHKLLYYTYPVLTPNCGDPHQTAPKDQSGSDSHRLT